MPSLKCIAPINDLSALGEVSRRAITALASSDIDLTIQPISLVDTKVPNDETLTLLHRFVQKKVDYNNVLVFADPISAADLLRTEAPSARKIVYCGTCSNNLPHTWTLALNWYADEVWTVGNRSAELMREAGVSSYITAIGYPVDTSERDSAARLKLQASGADPVTDSTFLFYSIGRWTEKKNYRALLEAYWAAFSSSDDVCLVLKPYYSNASADEAAQIQSIIDEMARFYRPERKATVLLLSNVFQRRVILGLHKRCDCYVEPSRWDSFGTNLIDACLMGNEVICSDASSDVFSIVDVPSVPSRQKPVSGMPQACYSNKDRWFDMNFEDLSDRMLRAYRGDTFVRSDTGKLSGSLMEPKAFADSVISKLV